MPKTVEGLVQYCSNYLLFYITLEQYYFICKGIMKQLGTNVNLDETIIHVGQTL